MVHVCKRTLKGKKSFSYSISSHLSQKKKKKLLNSNIGYREQSQIPFHIYTYLQF